MPKILKQLSINGQSIEIRDDGVKFNCHFIPATQAKQIVRSVETPVTTDIYGLPRPVAAQIVRRPSLVINLREAINPTELAQVCEVIRSVWTQF